MSERYLVLEKHRTRMAALDLIPRRQIRQPLRGGVNEHRLHTLVETSKDENTDKNEKHAKRRLLAWLTDKALIGWLEPLFDDGQVFVFAYRAILVGIRSRKLPCTQCPRSANSSRCTKRSHICNRWPFA